MTTQDTDAPGMEVVTLEQVEDVLLHGGVFEAVSEADIQRDMIRRILSAESMEEAFATFETTPLDMILGSKVSITGIAWLRSAYKDGPPVFALLKVQLLADHVGTGKKGDELTVSMGGATTMASFVWAQRHANMPFSGHFERNPSRSNPEKSFIVFKLA